METSTLVSLEHPLLYLDLVVLQNAFVLCYTLCLCTHFCEEQETPDL